MTLKNALSGGCLDPGQVGRVQWEPCELWRVFAEVHGPAGFNATNRGNARFSPLEHAGAIIPAMYAATSVQAALMETVLHDAPIPSAGFILTLEPAKDPRRVVRLLPSMPLKLADLSTVGLRRLGLSRSDVIDSDKTHYPDTQALAQWIYAACPDVQGMAWTSRQDDAAQAIVLFETRLRLTGCTLTPFEPATDFFGGPHHAALIELVDRLGASLMIVP
jgi:RES domain